MNSIPIKLHGVNPISIPVYAGGRATKEQTVKIFATYFIKSDLWFHILKFVYQRNIPHPKNIGEVLSIHHRQFCTEALFFQYEKKKF